MKDTDHTALDAYAALDLSPGSPTSEALLKDVREKVSADRTIKLHEGVGQHVGLTPAMDGWAERHVFGMRIAAVDQIRSAYETDTTSKAGGSKRAAVGGQFVALEKERVEREWTGRQVALINDFHNSNEALSNEKDEAEREYDQMRMSEGNRDPVRMDWRYPAALLGIVAIEWMINFDSLSKVPYLATPALAFGASIVVAAGVGGSAHLQGEVLKQWSYYFDSGEDKLLREGIFKEGLASFLLMAALAFIGYSRYFLLLPAIQESEALGTTPPSVIVSVGASVLTNVIVWGVGVAASIYFHDRNPEFPKKQKRCIDAGTKLEALRRQKLDHPFKQAEARFRQRMESLDSFERAQAGSGNADRNRDMLAKLKAADAKVVGLLKEYKQQLVERWRQDGQEPRFTIFDPVPDRRDHQRKIDGDEFLRHPVHLRLEKA